MNERLVEWIAILIVLPCGASIAAGSFVILQELTTWLKTATWVTPSLYEGLIYFFGPAGDVVRTQTGYLGLDEIIAHALLSPLALWLIVIGPVIWLFGWNLVWKACEAMR